MKGEKQKISTKETYPQKNRTASKGYAGGQTFMGITENHLTDNNRSGYGLLEFILSPSNLNTAYKWGKQKKGAGGVDKMDVESLKDYLVENKDKLIVSILRGKYRPSPVRWVRHIQGQWTVKAAWYPDSCGQAAPTTAGSKYSASP